MDDLTKSDSAPLEHCQQQCEYCGAVVNQAFYFCLSCATPYKGVSTVVTQYIPPQLSESELIQKKSPHVWSVFWTYCIVLFVSLLFSLIVGDNYGNGRDIFTTHLIVSSVSISLATLVLGIIFKASIFVQLKRFGFNNRYAWYCLLILIPALFVNFGYHHFVKFLAFKEGGHLFESCYTDIVDGLGVWGAIVLLCILPAITEEIAFRGLVQHWLYAALKPWRAILLASVLFAALHLNVISFFYLFGLGILLGWARHKTGSLYPSMLIHFLHNLIVILYFGKF